MSSSEGEAEVEWGVRANDGAGDSRDELPEVSLVDEREGMELTDDLGFSERMDDIRQATDWLFYCRQRYGPSGRSLDAFQALCRAYARAGTRIDALPEHNQNEWERFQSRLVKGADGHVFWNGRGRDFQLNAVNGKQPSRRPAFYWWERVYGERARRLTLCAVEGCILPYHAREENGRPRERIFTEQAIIGALQVWQLRHGRAPTRNEWRSGDQPPSTTTICNRFGSFERALAAAGLESTRTNQEKSVEELLAGLHAVAQELHRWPLYDEYRHAATGRFPAMGTLCRHFGGFAAAVEAARAAYPSL
jgi:hypothetical protein